jgi:hypothetical protein
MCYFWSKAFFNTVDWWGICPTGPLPLPHNWKKMAYCPKARSLGLVWVNEFNIEKKFKKLNLLVSILNWTYVVFECLACNLLQISSLKLFLKMCPQNARNAISGTQILNPSLANSSLRYSIHTFGDRILSWGRARREWALWQFCPTLTEESLKNVLFWRTFQCSYPFKYLKLALWYDNSRPHA